MNVALKKSLELEVSNKQLAAERDALKSAHDQGSIL
jgi:hypothetical protein